ncbi:dimethylsulfoniopropionate lyase [Oryzicola mucosus]|uniref:Dimethylsulfoniopropionate lyase n=1 Tax=Oryzicola mucosus TaxID=2767425 RepID=A0A8J6U5U5_9HYPH|nr:dimethylsulfoniopropionate lyase [Oryzicola mucosus]MBD0416995.1 dimethylsulfoniopropionate lyase [Oryzicola mucosus]
MAARREDLQSFLEAASIAFRQFATAPSSQTSLQHIFAALEKPCAQRGGAGSRLPVCEVLDSAFWVDIHHDTLRKLMDRFKALEPILEWRTRTKNDGTASANFAEGHANAIVVGPGGLESREDVWLGVSLLAPNVRYPDHDHAPEEVYLVLSQGEFRQGDGEWFSPGIGGSFYNAPGIKHAMRSLDTPLLAFWALRVDAA